MRVAALDLGSSSFRLVVADWLPGRGLVPCLQRRVRLNLGMVVGREGRIPELQAVAAVKAVTRLRHYAEQAGADRIMAVATSALRDARNREKVARRLVAAAGVPVRVLSGAEEAALTFAALRTGLPLGGGRVMGLDLGGGSLELAVGTGDRLDWTASLPLGAARLVGATIAHDPATPLERLRLAEHIDQMLAPLPDGAFWPATCAAAGGTVKSLARLARLGGLPTPNPGQPAAPPHRAAEQQRRRSGPRSLHGAWLSAEQVHGLAQRLLAMGPRERRRLPQLDRHRADVLGAGATVIGAVLSRAGLDGLTVSEWGLREGVILQALALVDLAAPPPGQWPALSQPVPVPAV